MITIHDLKSRGEVSAPRQPDLQLAAETDVGCGDPPLLFSPSRNSQQGWVIGLTLLGLSLNPVGSQDFTDPKPPVVVKEAPAPADADAGGD